MPHPNAFDLNELIKNTVNNKAYLNSQFKISL